MRQLNRMLKLVAALMVVLVVGCSSGPAPSDYFYRIEAVNVTADKTVTSKAVEVEKLKSDLILDERNLLHRDSINSPELKQYTYHRWTDTPTRMIQQSLIRGLRAANFSSKEIVSPDAGSDTYYTIRGRVYNLEENYNETEHTVVIDMDLVIRDDQKRKNILVKNYRHVEKVSVNEMEKIAEAYNRAFENILQAFLKDASGLKLK